MHKYDVGIICSKDTPTSHTINRWTELLPSVQLAQETLHFLIFGLRAGVPSYSAFQSRQHPSRRTVQNLLVVYEIACRNLRERVGQQAVIKGYPHISPATKP